MGPSRLRRGFSLEVIFEEDSDFCSHLDSLDSVSGGPTKYPDQISVDSLVEEDEESEIEREEDDEDSELRKIQLLLHHQPTSPIESTSFDAIFHLRDMESCLRDWDQSGSSHPPDQEDHMDDNKEPRSTTTNDNLKEHLLDQQQERGNKTGEIPLINNGRLSRVSRREILSASWLTKDEDEDEDDDKMTMTPSPPVQFSLSKGPTDLLLDWGESDKDNENDSDAASTLTNSTDTDSHIYAVADPCDEIASIASSTFDCSESMTLTRCPLVDMEEADCLQNVKRVREMFEMGDKLVHGTTSSGSSTTSDHIPSLPPRNPVQMLNSDLLSIPASKCHGGILKDSSPPPPSPPVTLLPTPSTPTLSSQTETPSQSQSQTQGEGTGMRSAYSSFNLHRLASYDFVDLLVNDRVVIEEAPDIFQTIRSTRQREGAVVGSKWDLGGGGQLTTGPILRRSKSMGTGIFVSEESTHRPTPTTTILTEEIQPSWPAPNIVKNVRNVFEQLCLKNLKKPDNTNGTTMTVGSTKSRPPPVSNLNSNFKTGGSSSIVGKQFLSSVKSNPTSKIFRSESLRDNGQVHNSLGMDNGVMMSERKGFFKSLTSKGGKNVQNKILVPTVNPTTIMTSPSPLVETESIKCFKKEQVGSSCGEKKVEDKVETIVDKSKSPSFVPMIGGVLIEKVRGGEEEKKKDGEVPRKLSHEKMTESEPEMTEELNSLLSSIGEDEEPKWIPDEVLSRIRSHGTTTTYFGGEIVGKTVKNRKLLVQSSKTESNGGGLYENSSDITPCLSPVFTDLVMSMSHLSDSKRPPMTSTNSSSPENLQENEQEEELVIPIYHHDSGFGMGTLTDSNSKSSMDNVPRIVSVLPKSPSNSKSNSPSGSIIEGRNSPEGCESQAVITLVETLDMLKSDSNNNHHISSNNNNNKHHLIQPLITTQVEAQVQIVPNTNNNNNNTTTNATTTTPSSKGLNEFKFSEIAEGAWF